MTGEVLALIVRHLLTAGGVYFASRYEVEQATLEPMIGGVAAMVGLLWSVADKKRRRK